MVAGGCRRASERLLWARFRRTWSGWAVMAGICALGVSAGGLPASLFGVRLLVGAGD